MKCKETYQVYSPDGFPIEINKLYKSLAEVQEAIIKFVKRYERQGYYSTVRGNKRVQIPISEIEKECTIIDLSK